MAFGSLMLATVIVGCGSSSSNTSSTTAPARPLTAPSATSASGFKSCQGTAANGYFKQLKVTIVSCEAGRAVMTSYAKVFLYNGSRPPAVVHVQGFSCVNTHPNGDTRIDSVVCKGTGDNAAVEFGGRSQLPQPSG
jgi:hypothetical protein